MLSCDEVRARLSDAIDGNVRWWTRVQMRVHLAMCNDCAAIARSLRNTVSLLRALHDAPVAEGAVVVDPRGRDGGSPKVDT